MLEAYFKLNTAYLAVEAMRRPVAQRAQRARRVCGLRFPKLFRLPALGGYFCMQSGILPWSMFAHLLIDGHGADDVGENPAAAVALNNEAAEAAANRGRARGRGRGGRGRGARAAAAVPGVGRAKGRARGYVHTPLSKSRIQASMLKRSRDRAQNTLRQMSGPGMIQRVFGSTAKPAPQAYSRIPAGDGQHVSVPVGTWNRNERELDKVLVSHVKQQAQCSKLFLEDDQASFFLFTNVFDDASMWMRNVDGHAGEEPLIQAAPTELGKRIRRKHRPQGRMVHKPTLSLCETMYKFSSSDARRSTFAGTAARLHSPSQPLPAANYSTVLSRWKRWTLASGFGPGPSIDPDGILQSPLETKAWKSIVLAKDCLELNNNIVCRVEQALASARQSAAMNIDPSLLGGVPTLFHLNCQAHSAVLCAKPLIQAYDGLSAYIVRLGHLCQNHRFTTRCPARVW